MELQGVLWLVFDMMDKRSLPGRNNNFVYVL